MQKPNNYDNVEAIERGEFKQIEPGAYKCVIKAVELTISSKGNEMLVIDLDITDGEFKNYYTNLYENDEKRSYSDPKWRGKFYQLTDGEHTSYFKGLISAIEKSNQGYKFDFEEKNLVGKYICGVFGREQFEAKDGELKFTTKCVRITSLEKMEKGIEPPKDKLVNGTMVTTNSTSTNGFNAIAESIDDDDLPF